MLNFTFILYSNILLNSAIKETCVIADMKGDIHYSMYTPPGEERSGRAAARDPRLLRCIPPPLESPVHCPAAHGVQDMEFDQGRPNFFI